MRSLERGRCWGREKNGNRRGGAFSISTSTLDIVGLLACLVLFFVRRGVGLSLMGRARTAGCAKEKRKGEMTGATRDEVQRNSPSPACAMTLI